MHTEGPKTPYTERMQQSVFFNDFLALFPLLIHMDDEQHTHAFVTHWVLALL